MRAIVISRPGGPEVLEIRGVPMPEPGHGEIRVRVRAFCLNRADLLQCRGLYPAPPGWPRDIPGLEYSGEVDAVGPGAAGISFGDRVMGIVGGGSYAEYLVTPAAHAVPVPGGMSFEDAAAIPEAFITAFDALDRLDVVAGEWVLVHAVGSGVGTAVVQLAKARAASCIGTSRTRGKLVRAQALGLDVGVDSAHDDFVAAVKQVTGQGTQCVVDLIGGAQFPKTLDAMARCGRLILVGLTAGQHVEMDLGVILRKRLRIEGTVLRGRSNDEKSVVIAAFAETILPLFSEGRLVPVVDDVFPFEEIRAAHERLASNATFGNVVVQV